MQHEKLLNNNAHMDIQQRLGNFDFIVALLHAFCYGVRNKSNEKPESCYIFHNYLKFNKTQKKINKRIELGERKRARERESRECG